MVAGTVVNYRANTESGLEEKTEESAHRTDYFQDCVFIICLISLMCADDFLGGHRQHNTSGGNQTKDSQKERAIRMCEFK